MYELRPLCLPPHPRGRAMPMTASRLTLDSFAGAWSLDREIADLHQGSGGTLTGRAVFTPEADGLAYVEEGRLRMTGQPELVATRRYLWRDAGPGTIAVLFEDGRPFHHIALDRLMPDDNHICGADFYHVTYDFTHWPRWSAAWRVQGPRKDYRMVSRYAPAD